jgi:hypothetical protein
MRAGTLLEYGCDMRRLSLLNATPCLALLALAVGCAMDAGSDSGPLYEGDSASAGGTAAGDPSGDGSGGEGAGEGADEGESGGAMAGQLTAGEWRDLDHWSFWLDLLKDDAWSAIAGSWKFDTTQRYAVVVESDGVHVADASVTLLAGEETVWSARTDAHGEAELFAGMFAAAPAGPLSVKVAAAGHSATVEDVKPASEDPIVVAVPKGAPPAAVLDLMFVIDTTGSMGDELGYLQAELGDVIDQVRAGAGAGLKLRVSVNFYRDSEDEYLVRAFPFTEDVDQAIDDLNAQTADGGGDWPEAVDSALADAIEGHAWSESAVARLCFVVLDAPPHDGEQPLAQVQASVRAAAAKGVRMIPLAASGTDKSLEFLLRFSAVATGGTYTFLTDHSGIGGSHIEPTIGEYQVEYLNDLMVRLISKALVD